MIETQPQTPIFSSTSKNINKNPKTMMMHMMGRKSSSESSSSLLPPRIPGNSILSPDDLSRQGFHMGHLQLATSEDLSFSDLNLEDDPQNGQHYYSEPVKSKSLAGFLEAPSVFRRRSKISSVDVASVGDASETAVSVDSSQYVSGRDLHEKAKMLFNAGNYSGALPLFESILSAQVRRFSPLHPSVGAAMHNVGVCRQRLGQFALAENLFEEAVQIRRQTLGKDHLEVAASLSKLGAAQTALHKFDDAFMNLRDALKITRKNLGKEHKTVAQMLCHLACFYFESGEILAAQGTFEDALEMYRDVFPTVPSSERDAMMTQITDTLCNIGSIKNRRKRFQEAIESFSEALDLQRGIVGHDDSRIISTLDNLGYSYSKKKEYANSLTCYRKMLRAQISNEGTFSKACYETFRKEILMYEKLKKYSEAVDEIRENLQMQKSMLSRDCKIIVDTKNLLEEMKAKKQRSRDGRV